MVATAPAEITGFRADAMVRGVVRALPAYHASRPRELPQRLIRLDMNESPYGPSPKARAALAAFDQTHRYPDFGQTRLRAALSAYTGVPAEQIVAGAGLDDVFTTLMHLVIDPGDEIVISEPTFSVYRILASLHAATTVDAPLDLDFSLDAERVLNAITDRTKLVIVCTPNNPTGNVLDEAAVARICEEAPCLVAIDEAYAEFAGSSYLPFVARYPNVVVLRTMSKFAGMAGMRVGYGMFPEALLPYLHHAIPPFHNVSMASVEAVVASLDDLDHLRTVVARIIADRESLATRLRSVPGLTVYPSETNFLLVRLPIVDAAPVVSALAGRGVLVRSFPLASLGLTDCIRITVGTGEENALFLDALDAALHIVSNAP